MSNTEHIPGNSFFFIFHVITKNTRVLQAQPAYSHKLKLHQILAKGKKVDAFRFNGWSYGN